ncbi:hypothetical protein SDC9_100692 [bioreactor metagenome]|uniref:3D domain-containing protein n=1 Tax=bioreactor metagenome TaxID=1076179 RepID=A0A645AL14_9ZZZZ|nr:hypothetical protein [Oscillospiraceae bacterium]
MEAYTLRVKQYSSNISVSKQSQTIPSSPSILSSGLVDTSNSRMEYEVTIEATYTAPASTEITFGFENINTSTQKLVSSNNVTVYADSNNTATATAIYHVLGTSNLTPVVTVSVYGTQSALYEPTINITTSASYDSTFLISGYVTALESDPSFSSSSVQITANIYQTSNTEVLILPKKFVDAINCEGDGRLTDGRYVHYNSTNNYTIYPSDWHVSGAAGKYLIPFESCAVDPSHIIMRNSTQKYANIFISGVNCYLTALDTGSAINDYIIDVYCGAITYDQLNAYSWGMSQQNVTLNSIYSY